MGHSSLKVTYHLYSHLFDEAEADNATATRIEAMFTSERNSNVRGSKFRRHSATRHAEVRKPAEKLGSASRKFAEEKSDV